MDVLVTCKYEEDPINNEGTRVLTRSYDVFSEAQGQLTPKSAAEFCQKFELIQAFIVVLVTCKNEEDPIINEKRGNKQCLLDTPPRVTVIGMCLQVLM